MKIVSKTGWTLKYVCCEMPVSVKHPLEGPARFAFDDNTISLWHSKYNDVNGNYVYMPHPHDIQIDMGQSHKLTAFRYLPRQDYEENGTKAINGTIKGYEFYISDDGTNWGSPVSSGNFASNTDEKEVIFTAKSGRYIRLRSLSEILNQPYASVAEITVLEEEECPELINTFNITTVS